MARVHGEPGVLQAELPKVAANLEPLQRAVSELKEDGGVDLLDSMYNYCPSKRPTAKRVREHPFLPYSKSGRAAAAPAAKAADSTLASNGIRGAGFPRSPTAHEQQSQAGILPGANPEKQQATNELPRCLGAVALIF